MKLDKTVRYETLYITLWVIVCSALLESVFLIIGKWDHTVLTGNVLGAAAAAANFLLMGVTVQKAVLMDKKRAASYLKISQSLRMLLIFAVAGVGVLLPYFNTVAVLVPLFFPRIAILFRPLFGKKKDRDESV